MPGDLGNYQSFDKFPKSKEYTTLKYLLVFGKFPRYPGIWEILIFDMLIISCLKNKNFLNEILKMALKYKMKYIMKYQ